MMSLEKKKLKHTIQTKESQQYVCASDALGNPLAPVPSDPDFVMHHESLNCAMLCMSLLILCINHRPILFLY